MPTTVKTGWLKDKNGDKFAPKTLTSQVQTSDGILIEDKIQADLETLQKTVDSKANASHTHSISNITNLQSTLDGKANASHTHDYIPNSLKGAANGLAELDSSGKVLSSQLPSYVDDVIEGYLYNSKFYKESAHTTVITGETGKIYIDLSSSKTYRWSGSAFAEISASLALGETSSTAYRGDRGKIAYDHSQTTHAPSDAEKNVQSDWNETNTSSDAFIKNKPTIPTTASDVGAVPTTRKVNNKALSADINLTASDVGAATTNDITNAINNLDSTVSAETGKYISAITQTNGKITATKASLPTIPTVNNATLTIQKNGTNVATFTANSATNATANITVPTGAAADKGVDTSISASSTSTNLPTSKAVAAFVEGKGYKTTDNNTTYTVATGDGNGQIKVTPSSGSAYNVSVKGLGSAAFTEFSAYEASGSAGMALSHAKAYTDEAVAQKSQVKMKIWTESDIGGT